ncbi:MAG: gamma-glutamylcyclotransferase [Devosia sp.]|uniref:gamma-glutamylcyclotransferase family protein n=1 Tax=Devosia sp. TaxID=1871048 RepID=UPI0024C8819D|nr:gamma-glutamylcyclotransferase family protein [Devosia sp.]UYN98987.1 MAG: gamma-glutamylcyclotransferase [Devosia sp.]
MLYFAYGSNMDPVQMRERCPGSAFAGIGMLQGHGLCFPRYSIARKCGAASYEADPARNLWGVVYRMTESDFVRLDGNEDYRPDRAPALNSYNRLEIDVLMANVPTRVHTYLANPQDGVHSPSAAYLRHLQEGARHHGLPEDYRLLLERLASG